MNKVIKNSYNERKDKMKKLILVFSALLLLLVLTGCGIFNLGGWTVPDDLEFIELVKRLDTPQKIGQYMTDNFTYKIHDFYAPDPYTLWKIQEGDCNDFSTFGVFIANYHGYETYQIKIFDETLFTHYVAVYAEAFSYSITDNQYYYFGFYDFEEIVEYICYTRFKTWTKYIVYDYDMKVVERGEN